MDQRILEPLERMAPARRRVPDGSHWPIALLVAVLLAAITVAHQQQQLGLHYIDQGTQLARHQAVLNGTAPVPWGYRVLSEYVAAGFIWIFRKIAAPYPNALGFLSVRLLQNAGIFLLGFAYYRALGLKAREAVIGLVLLAYSMTHALHNSDLSLNTYGDVLFYLLAGWVTLDWRYPWMLLPISILAALNRETSLLIPLLPLAPLVARAGRDWRRWRQPLVVSAVCLLAHVAVLLALRLVIHPPSASWEQTWGTPQGWDTVLLNLGSHRNLLLLALTFSALPILALWKFPFLSPWLRGMFWLVIPVWMAIHFTMAYANETRLFLVPIALVLVPAALYGRAGAGAGQAEDHAALTRPCAR